ncbi:MAG: Bug family tripartite tricarboxylate transporter substrate binding protein [Betaproteobacteria bacterium]
MRWINAALASAVAAVHLWYAGPVAAQSAKDYPNRPIRLVIPQTAGSSTDTMSRVLATKLGELMGQQIVVDNRTGAGGVIGASIVATSEPDGYTLLCAATPSQVIGPQLYKNATKYDPFKAFTPVGKFAVTQNVLIANQKAPFNNVKELIGYARANPGKLNWGNAGIGFQSHLAGVLFTHMAKINVLHVAYKGAGPMVTGVISGESQLTLGPAPAWMTHVQAGRVRALAMAGEKRSILWPDLPTITESGLPGFASDGWAGLMGPGNLPKPILDKLHAMLIKAVNDPATNEALKRVGAEPSTTTPGEFSALIQKDWKTYGEAIRIANVKVE